MKHLTPKEKPSQKPVKSAKPNVDTAGGSITHLEESALPLAKDTEGSQDLNMGEDDV